MQTEFATSDRVPSAQKLLEGQSGDMCYVVQQEDKESHSSYTSQYTDIYHILMLTTVGVRYSG